MQTTDFSTIVGCAELARQLNNPHWVVVDCRFDLTDTTAGLRAYTQSHIPGARYAHLDDDLSSRKTGASGRHPLPAVAQFARRLESWGIQSQTQVVAYDNSGGSIAARLWWLLNWLGHKRVAVLDGGWKQWLRLSLPTTQDITAAPPAQFTPHLRERYYRNADEILERLQTRDFRLIDARAPERFRGEQEPIDPVAGHVPGAVNIPFAKHLDPEGLFLPPEQLRELFRSQIPEIDSGRVEIAAMCGSGVTACHTLLALELAGITGGQLYAGSWSEWIRDPRRPIARG